jgi:hypothetical protein
MELKLMIDDKFIYETLFSKLNVEFSDDLIFYKAFQENSKSYSRYATIYINNYNVKNEHKEYFDRESPKERQSNILSFLVQIDFYDDVDNLIVIVEKVKAFLKSDNCAYVFNKKGLYLKKFSQARSLPEEVKNKWKYRKTFDFHIEFIDTHEFEVSHIKMADIQQIP